MRLAKFMTAVAVASMATAPVVAAPATSLLSLRSATKSSKQNELVPAVLIGVLATVAIVGGTIVIVDSDDTPDSP